MNINFLICIILLLSCNNTSVQKIAIEKTRVNHPNDTLCTTDLKRFKLKKAVLLKACQIVCNDSLSKARQLQFSRSELPKEFNFDDNHLPLFYVRNGDTIDLKILFLTQTKDTTLPDLVQIMGDTLFVREKTLPSNGKIGEFEFEEFHYKFLLKGDFNPIIMHKN